MITVEKCPCGHPGCRDYHLQGFGKFVQGSGFTRAEAERIAHLLNTVNVYQVIERAGTNHEVAVFTALSLVSCCKFIGEHYASGEEEELGVDILKDGSTEY